MRATIGAALAAFALAASAPALADVKTGVDYWNQGDYVAAVAEWRPLAIAGNADAQFNLGQSYKLGRGVPVDLPVALEWFRKASAQGHEKASDNYGLLLFQQGRREEAMPYIKASADRGEARAQYVYATALFNGDLAPRDWVRAYALMVRAAAAGVNQADASLAQMDQYVPEDQRAQGRALAATLPRASTPVQVAQRPPVPMPPRSSSVQPVDVPASAPAAPAPVNASSPPPPPPPPARPAPVLAARPNPPIIADEARARPAPPPPQPAAAPPPRAAAAPVATAASVPAPSASGRYRVQLGAFREDGRAQALWASLGKRVSGLSAFTPSYVPTGGLTRLLVGPLGSAAEAEKLCARIRPTGTPCLATAK